MSTFLEIEKQVLALPDVEREQLATLAWESLVVDPRVVGNRDIDPEGIEIAAQRDAEIEFGVVQTIGHAEFLMEKGSKPFSDWIAALSAMINPLGGLR